MKKLVLLCLFIAIYSVGYSQDLVKPTTLKELEKVKIKTQGDEFSNGEWSNPVLNVFVNKKYISFIDGAPFITLLQPIKPKTEIRCINTGIPAKFEN